MVDIDREGVKSLLRWEGLNSCVNCNVKTRIVNKTRCNPCHFSPSSSDRKTNPNYFTTGIAPKVIFKKYGVPVESWGKAQLFYFMYYPELNNEYSYPDSITDIYGNTILKENIKWILHHMDKQNWNDHVWNLLLCMNHEHPFFENLNSAFDRKIKLIYESIF